MTPVNHDLDDILRRALHAAADSIEPADDALQRIRRRMREPWLTRQVSLVRNDWVDLVQLIAIRLEPSATRVRAGIANGPLGASAARIRGRLPATALGASATRVRTGIANGPLGASAARIRGRLPATALGASFRRHDAAHRDRSAGGWAALRPTLAWLRPALAVATAVVVVMAGVYGLAQLRETLRLTLFPSSGPGSAAPSSSTQGQPGLGRPASNSPGGLIPTTGGSGSPRHAPRATCSRTVRKPTPGPSATATSTPTATSSATPTPAPTDSLNPSSTPSAISSTLTVHAILIAGQAASTGSVGAAAHCTQSSPKASPKPS
jgi:hypothetical protein